MEHCQLIIMKGFRYIQTVFLPLLTVVLLVIPVITKAANENDSVIGGALQKVLYAFVVTVFGMLVRFGAMLLNAGIDYFVIGFGGLFNSSGVGVAVNNTWVIIRDFVNLFFIFGLLYIGFKMILGNDSANARRWLAKLIIAALFVNFSLFVTKFVVDFSNQISKEIVCAGLTTEGSCQGGTYNTNIGQKFMNHMGVSSILNGQPEGTGWGYIFGTAILFMVTAFVFAAGGILLIIRFAILNLFLVLSPIMFAGFVLPMLGDTMGRYWRDFLKRCFFAPIYLMFLYFSFQIIGGLQQAIKPMGDGVTSTSLAKPNWPAALDAGKDGPAAVQAATLGTLPFFVLIIIFMCASLVAANKLGAEGASKAISVGKNFRNKGISYTKRSAGAATAGAAGYAARGTVGRFAYNYAQSDKAKDRAARSFGGKLLYQAAQKTGNASFDARRAGGLGKELGIGEGQKGGYAAQIKKAKDDAKKFYGKDGLGFVDVDSPEGKQKVEDKKKEVKDRLAAESKEKQAALDSQKRIKEISDKDPEALKQYAENKQLERQQQQQRIDSFEADMRTMTPEQRERAKGRLAELQKELEPFLKREEEAQAAAELAASKAAIKKELEMLKRSEMEANQRGDNGAFQKAREAQAKKQAELDAINTGLSNNIKVLEKEVSDLDSTLKDTDKIGKMATAEVKFSRQIDYMKQLERSQKMWSNPLLRNSGAVGSTGLSAGALGGLGATAALGAGGLYGLTAGVAMNNRSESLKAVIKEIDKEYGKGGVKTVGKQARQAKRRENQEADKEDGGTGEDDKKDDDKK